jgi:uncharacterized protein (TIGR00156 family)
MFLFCRFILGGILMKKPAILTVCCLAIITLFLALIVFPRPGFPIHAPMRVLFFVSCLAILFVGVSVMYSHAESHGLNRSGFIESGVNPPPSSGFQGQYGFIGPSRTSTAAQALNFEHRSPVILTGNLVQSIGADLYIFRDSSGEINVRIGPLEWQNTGFNISSSDSIEISGEVHKDMGGFQRPPEVHARHIRKI